MARYERGNDATAARKLARSEPLSGRNARSNETPRRSSIERLKPGDDPTPAIERLYRYGRSYPDGPRHDRAPERTPEYRVPSPSRDAEYAGYDLGKNSPVTPAPDQSQPQFRDDKTADHVDTREAWCRAMAKEQHPFFDKGGSGNRYRK